MPIVISARVQDTPTQEDKRAMQHIVDQENARRAALDPPGSPLPDSTNSELKNSYEEVQTALLVKAHASYIEQSDVATWRDMRQSWADATDAQRNAALTALTT